MKAKLAKECTFVNNEIYPAGTEIEIVPREKSRLAKEYSVFTDDEDIDALKVVFAILNNKERVFLKNQVEFKNED